MNESLTFTKKYFFTYHYIGGMGKLRRNLENTNAFSQATHKEVLDIKATIARIESNLESLATQVHKAAFQSVMSGCDISEFFPVERNEQLEAFMDRSHPEWEDRKAEFYNFLYTIATKTKKGFATGLIKAIFSRQYICGAKWPSFG